MRNNWGKILKLVGLIVIGLLVLLTGGLLYFQEQFATNTPQEFRHTAAQTTATIIANSLTEPTAPEPIDIIFTGDVMLDRHIRTNAELNGYDSLLDTSIKTMFEDVDYVVYNLEGPITTNPSISVGSAVGSTNNYLFTFDPEVTDFLTKYNMKIASLGNNHTLNFGQEGLATTYQYLNNANIEVFGDAGPDTEASKRLLITEHGGLVLAFINYNQFVTNSWQNALDDLEQAKSQADLVFVYTHWGNEYVPENQVLINQAHQLIDAGADAIIGSHPHVVTGTETYADKKIYYSLGNFIFDQYFEPAVSEGMMIKMTIDPATLEISYQEFMVEMDKSGQTSLLQNTN